MQELERDDEVTITIPGVMAHAPFPGDTHARVTVKSFDQDQSLEVPLDSITKK